MVLSHATPVPLDDLDAAISGDLGAFGLPEILEFLRLQRANGTLTLRSGLNIATFGFTEGQIVRGPNGSAKSRKRRTRLILRALRDVMGWKFGRFSFRRSLPEPLPRLSIDPQEALLTLMQEQDESSRDEAALADEPLAEFVETI
jgi:hypothetical protein